MTRTHIMTGPAHLHGRDPFSRVRAGDMKKAGPPHLDDLCAHASQCALGRDYPLTHQIAAERSARAGGGRILIHADTWSEHATMHRRAGELTAFRKHKDTAARGEAAQHALADIRAK